MRLLDVLSQKTIYTVPPVWMMRQAGRYLPEYRAIRQHHKDFINFCFTPKDVVEVTVQPIQRFDFDAAIIFSDILVIPHVLGQRVWFEANHGPKLAHVDFDTLMAAATDVDFEGSLKSVTDAITQTRQILPNDKALIGFAGAPWTLLTYMISEGKTADFNDVLAYVSLHPERAKSLMSLLEVKVAQLLCMHIKAGANVVQIFESWAAAVPPALRDLYLYEPLDRIVKIVRSQHPTVPIIYYGRGVSADYAKMSHLDIAFGVDESADLPSVRKALPTHVLQGNLSPATLLSGNGIEAEVDRILHAMAGTPHIFNLGHGINKDTPIAHVERMLSHLRSYKGA